MSFQWSISTDRLFRRCQRQFFFREIAASHAAKDWRREAFILKQLKTLELWRGTLIHEGIQHYLVPALKKGAALNWDELAERNVQRAKEQLDFSAKRRYREEGMVKGEHEDFCALVPHESGEGVSSKEFDEVCGEIRAAYRRLCMMLPRLKLLREFLTDDGVIFISIDDNEVHWLRGLLDEVFGEENFVATIIWEKVYSPKSSARFFSENHDYIVAYARRKESFELGLLPRTEEANARYENPDKDKRGPWKPGDLSARNPYSKGVYSIRCPAGRVIKGPPPGNYWRVSEENLWRLHADNRIWWGEDKNQVPAIKRFLSEVKQGLVPETIWTYKEVGHTQDAKRSLLDIFGDDFQVFTTPKPVELIKRIIRLCTEEESIVMDAFAGSATTAHAVLEMNRQDGAVRRFLLIESEGYADTLTAERIRRVIKGVPEAKDEALKKGLGGTFTFVEVGNPMHMESLLKGSKLPSFEDLAGYVFYTATGEDFDARAINRKTGFIGTSARYDVYLYYEPDLEYLKRTALTLDMARGFPKGSGKRRLVFAPTKYLDSIHLEEHRIDFCQLPFEIYKAAKPKKP